MNRFVVLTTETCGKCRDLKEQASKRGITSIRFVDALSEEGERIRKQTGLTAIGRVIDLTTNELCTLGTVIKAEQE